MANVLRANLKSSEIQLSKMAKLGGFLGNLFGQLLKTGLPLIGNVLKPLAKRFLVRLALTTAVSATDADEQSKETFWAGHPSKLAPWTKPLIISFEEMDDIMKIVKSLEEFRFNNKSC